MPALGRQKKASPGNLAKQWNTLLAGLRVVVERGIGGMKRYNAASGVYRNRLPKTDDKFNLLSAGLWNFYIN
jgi:hypothetical protein